MLVKGHQVFVIMNADFSFIFWITAEDGQQFSHEPTHGS